MIRLILHLLLLRSLLFPPLFYKQRLHIKMFAGHGSRKLHLWDAINQNTGVEPPEWGEHPRRTSHQVGTSVFGHSANSLFPVTYAYTPWHTNASRSGENEPLKSRLETKYWAESACQCTHQQEFFVVSLLLGERPQPWFSRKPRWWTEKQS